MRKCMDTLCNYLRANTNTLIWCKTYETKRFIGDLITIILKDKDKLGKKLRIADNKIYCWDAASGLSFYQDEKFVAVKDKSLRMKTMNPAGLLNFIESQQDEFTIKKGENKTSITESPIFILKNFHMMNRSSSAPNVVQGLINLRESTSLNIPVILLSPTVDIPEEEAKLFTIFDYDLPDEEEIKDVIKHTADQINRASEAQGGKKLVTEAKLKELVTASKGLTYNEVDDCCRKSLVMNHMLDPDMFRREKINIVKKSGCLDFKETTKSTFEDMGGNEEFKKWIVEEKELFNPKAKEFGLEMPKGYICFGPAGSGKSASAEMTASLLGVPLLELNFSKIMGSLVGQSERAIDNALSVVKAVAPCVLLLDECEKVLGGYASSNQSDSGTLSRVLGRLLSFMQDNDSGVFIVMTSNDITKLPPELMRTGRLDAQWYFGLPNSTERKSIFNVYLKKHNRELTPSLMKHAVKVTEHFTGAEIKATVSIMMRKLWIRYTKNNSIDTSKFTKADIDAAVSEIVPVYRYASDTVIELQQYARNRARFASKPEEKSTNIVDDLSNDISVDSNDISL